ncbi:MAG TPA: phytoene desaturase family protein [Bacteroidia bacterium]|nr:phytoene desaturase family protein [Bacteroidia bacterium]
MNKKVLIIGSGLGSLATALRLTTKGYQVEIVEKYHQPGGRLNSIQKDGFSFDMGPSFFSMSYEFKELFDSCGINNPLKLNELDPLYAVHFEGRKKPYLIYKDLQKLAAEFEGIEEDLLRKTEKYLATAGKLFHDTENLVIRQNFSNKLHYLSQLTKVPIKHTPKMFRSMWKELEMHFDSQEVKVIFSLVAFFLGSTPFQTPAVYSLLNYTELVHDGYWNVQGGMYKIVTELCKILYQRGVKMHFNSEITGVDITDGQISALIDHHGKRYSASVYVCNSDAASFRGKVLNRPKYSEQKLDSMEWTLAPFTIYLGVKGKLDHVHHHNYFLGSNFNEYASSIFKTQVSPQKPYYYVNVSSRSNPESAPEGCENLFILCPVPDLRYKSGWNDSEQLADTIVKDLSSRIGYDLSANTLTRTVMNPIDWQNNFNLYRGSGLGLAHGLNQIGGFRPSNKDEVFDNLYYVGASTVPGTGLPIVVISSRLVTERIEKDHAGIH